MAANYYGDQCTPNLGGVQDFYTKTEVNRLLSSKAGISTVYIRSYLDTEINRIDGLISGLSASQIEQSDLDTQLSSLQSTIESGVATTYATISDTYSKSEVDDLIDAVDLDPNNFLRKVPANSSDNTINPGSNDAIALTVRGSSTNAIVTQWLDNTSDVIGYISNSGSTTLNGALSVGSSVSTGGVAVDVNNHRITGVAAPILGSDAVSYSTLQTYVLDFYEEVTLPDQGFYLLNAGFYPDPGQARSLYRHLRSSTLYERPSELDIYEGEIALNFNTTSPGLFLKDTAGKIRKIGPAHVGESAPTASSLSNGEMWVDKSEAVASLKYYDEENGNWVELGSVLTVIDSGGDGSLGYDSSTATLTYTGPSAAEVRSHFSGGTGVTITDGTIAIGQPVAITDNVTFSDATLTGTLYGPSNFIIDPAAFGDDTGTVSILGNLQVQGTTTTVNSTIVEIEDKNIVLAKSATDAAQANGGGITVNGGNATLTYDSSNDSWNSNKFFVFNNLIKIGAAEPAAEAEVGWNTDKGTLDVGLLNGVISPYGQDIITLCRNNTASAISKGTAVMFTGTIGNSGRLTIAPMVSDGTYPGYVFFGVASQSIAAGEDGYIRSFGEIKGVNTDINEVGVDGQWAEGDILWCDPASPGGFTKFEPLAPNLKLPVAAVVSVGNNGIIFVRWDSGRRLQDLHDVEANGATTDNELLQYDASASRWEHVIDVTLPGRLVLNSVDITESARDIEESQLIRKNATVSIGVAGTVPFGVGPMIPPGMSLVGIGPDSYNVIDIFSGSVC